MCTARKYRIKKKWVKYSTYFKDISANSKEGRKKTKKKSNPKKVNNTKRSFSNLLQAWLGKNERYTNKKKY